MKPILGTTERGPLAIDVERLIQTRMLLTANSGAGKSWTLRRLLEQTHGRAQQLVIDPEGEFYTLRERLPYVLAGKGGDCPAEPRSAPLLARRLLELGASAVLDLYELAPRDRVRFVRAFLESLIDAPRTLWHPVLVVIDEAHAYAPEKGHGEAESAEAVARLMAQGRKRGFAGVLATQRLSKLAKDVAAEANNLLIGRAALDVDLKRAGEALGLPRGEWNTLRALAPGSFYAFGPALCETVQRVQVGPVATAHPQAGARATAAPPPPEKVRAVLAKLADLPAEAEAEARTADELRAKLRAVERELAQAKREQPAPSREQLENARIAALAEARDESKRTYGNAIARLAASAEAGRGRAARALDQALAQIKLAADALREPIDVPEVQSLGAQNIPRIIPAQAAVPSREFRRPVPATPAAVDLRSRSGESRDASLGKGERLCLIAISQNADGVTREQLSVLAGYKRSTRDAYVARLRGAGLVEDGSTITATDAGVAALGSDYKPLPTGEALRDYWLGRLPEGERKCLSVLIEAYPESVDRERVTDAVGYKRSTRDAYLQRLATRKLIESVGRGAVRASAELFS